jgi:hypothetical protein
LHLFAEALEADGALLVVGFTGFGIEGGERQLVDALGVGSRYIIVAAGGAFP